MPQKDDVQLLPPGWMMDFINDSQEWEYGIPVVGIIYVIEPADDHDPNELCYWEFLAVYDGGLETLGRHHHVKVHPPT